jgi:hypothetical protein
MKEITEVESLKLTNTIQQKVIKERGDQLVEAIICLHKIVPLAKKYARDHADPHAVDDVLRAEKFLHDER